MTTVDDYIRLNNLEPAPAWYSAARNRLLENPIIPVGSDLHAWKQACEDYDTLLAKLDARTLVARQAPSPHSAAPAQGVTAAIKCFEEAVIDHELCNQTLASQQELKEARDVLISAIRPAPVQDVTEAWKPIDGMTEAEKYGGPNNSGSPWLLYSPEIAAEHPDWYSDGIAEGFWQDGEGWQCAIWDNDLDCWRTIIFEPTHYRAKPSFRPAPSDDAQGEDKACPHAKTDMPCYMKSGLWTTDRWNLTVCHNCAKRTDALHAQARTDVDPAEEYELGQLRDRNAALEADKRQDLRGIDSIEEQLSIPAAERGFDFGTINRAIRDLQSRVWPPKPFFDHLSTRLNNVLVEMQPGYDDSITGFNAAWDIVREAFYEEINKSAPAQPQPVSEGRDDDQRRGNGK